MQSKINKNSLINIKADGNTPILETLPLINKNTKTLIYITDGEPTDCKVSVFCEKVSKLGMEVIVIGYKVSLKDYKNVKTIEIKEMNELPIKVFECLL